MEKVLILQIILKFLNDKKSVVLALIKVDKLFVPFMLIIALTGYWEEYFFSFISIIIHELGHTAVAFLFGQKLDRFEVLPIGLNVKLKGYLNTRAKRITVLVSGPLVNIILSISALSVNSLCETKSDNLYFFAVINIFLAGFNIIPMMPLDGGKIVNELISAWSGTNKAYKISRNISFTISVVFIIAGAFQMMSTIWNIGLIYIGVYILIVLKLEKSEVAFMNIKNIIFRRSRLHKKGIYPARDLVVVKTMQMKEVLKSLDFDRFHIIHVLDENLRLIKIFTEQEIIDNVFNKDSNMTFEEYILNEDATQKQY